MMQLHCPWVGRAYEIITMVSVYACRYASVHEVIRDVLLVWLQLSFVPQPQL